MIDLLFAEKNIHKYKLDYDGYLVIVDQIRTIEILKTNDFFKMQKHLLDLSEKYAKELDMMKKVENNKEMKKVNIYKLTQNQLIYELNYILKRLPAIGFILLGKGNEIGIYSTSK